MKTAGEILCDYIPIGTTDNGRDCWAQEQVLAAMEEYAKQFRKQEDKKVVCETCKPMVNADWTALVCINCGKRYSPRKADF